MKHIVLIIGLLVVGCGKQEQTLTLEEKVVGTYVRKNGPFAEKIVILENGTYESSSISPDPDGTIPTIPIDSELERLLRGVGQGTNSNEGTWKLVEKEFHLFVSDNFIAVHKIEPNGDLTDIAFIEDGKREDIPKEGHITLKKIK